MEVQALVDNGAAAHLVLLHVTLEALEVRAISVDQRLEAYEVGGM